MLAGDPATGESGQFPDQFSYALGADVSVNPRLTIAFDVLGRYLIDAERLRLEDFHGLDGESTFPNIVFERDSYNALSGSIGLKGNLFRRLLLDVNLLFALDENGLRDKVTPLDRLRVQFLTPPHAHDRARQPLPLLLATLLRGAWPREVRRRSSRLRRGRGR